jgi:hypothetical protein
VGREMVLNSDSWNNEKVHNELTIKVVRDYLGVNIKDSSLIINPLSPNYFSFTYSISAKTPEGDKAIFIKIPKNDLRGRIPRIMPITDKDRIMAQEEKKSLELLRKNWPGDNCGIEWIKLIGEVPDYNAIITERIFGKEAFAVFRKYDIRMRFGFINDRKNLEKSMNRLGNVLANYHITDSNKSTFYLSDELKKIEQYCNKLKTLVNCDILEKIMRDLNSIKGFSQPSNTVPTIKGLDIRNVLVDSDKNYFLLDPGKIKLAFREVDLARFIVTYRMLYWGSIKLVFLKTPYENAELAFLQGYRDQGYSQKILTILLIKEQLKHWLNIYDYINQINWDQRFKKIVSWFYIDPFFSRIINNDLKLLGEKSFNIN